MKLQVAVLLAFVGLTLALTDKQILQQGLNGVYEQNKLKDPTTIVDCGDDATAHKIVVFIGQALDKGAKGSVTDIIQLITMVKEFIASLPPATVDCVSNNPETQLLIPAYHLEGLDQATIEKKLAAYVTLHYLTVHKWLVDCDDSWNAQKYYETGFKGAGYLHNIFGLEIPNLTDKEIIQQTLNGLFEENKLKDPTTIVPCIDDDSAHKIVVFAGEVLDKAAKGSLSDLLSLPQVIKDFGNSLDPAVGTCLDGNTELAALSDAYNLTGADSSVVEKRILTYVGLHYLTVHKWLGDVDSDWHAAKYFSVGQKAAQEGHVILGMQLPELTDKEIIQQTLNGLFEENKLKDPTTIVPCIDDVSAHKIVVFIGEVLDKAAKGSLSDLLSLPQVIKDFGNSLDPAVGTCLDGNTEFAALSDAYNLTGADSSAVEKRVIEYVTLHYLSVHKWLGDVDSDWHAAKYFSVGQKAAQEGHVILKMQGSHNIRDRLNIIKRAIESKYNRHLII
jgi:hypothetical protein